MFDSNTVGGLRRFLARKMTAYSEMTSDFVAKIGEDVKDGQQNGYITYGAQADWLARRAVELTELAVAAQEAARIIYFLKNAEDDAEVLQVVKTEALRNVLARTRLNSRSSSASSNLAEDAKRNFWAEVGELVLK